MGELEPQADMAWFPDGDDGWGEREPYSVERGTCVFCGSGEVVHLVIGMPLGPVDPDLHPEWVHWVGCIHPGYARECRTCGARWTPPWVEDELAEEDEP